MNNGMAVYDYDTKELLGYTEWASGDVRKACKKIDGVYAKNAGSLTDRNCTEILVDGPAVAEMVFRRFGKWEPKAANAATEAQIRYLNVLGVAIEPHMTKARASQLIDAAKAGELGSVGGFYKDGSN
jgi:hypothetical protein